MSRDLWDYFFLFVTNKIYLHHDYQHTFIITSIPPPTATKHQYFCCYLLFVLVVVVVIGTSKQLRHTSMSIFSLLLTTRLIHLFIVTVCSVLVQTVLPLNKHFEGLDRCSENLLQSLEKLTYSWIIPPKISAYSLIWISFASELFIATSKCPSGLCSRVRLSRSSFNSLSASLCKLICDDMCYLYKLVCVLFKS